MNAQITQSCAQTSATPAQAGSRPERRVRALSPDPADHGCEAENPSPGIQGDRFWVSVPGWMPITPGRDAAILRVLILEVMGRTGIPNVVGQRLVALVAM